MIYLEVSTMTYEATHIGVYEKKSIAYLCERK